MAASERGPASAASERDDFVAIGHERPAAGVAVELVDPLDRRLVAVRGRELAGGFESLDQPTGV